MKPANASLNVTILGSGTCVPSLERSSCSVLIQVGRANLLLDCGAGTLHRLLEAGLTIFDITHILFSHFHPDHSAELVSFLFATKYPDSDRRDKPLTLVAGNGLVGFYNALRSAYNRWIELPSGLLHLTELSTGGPDGIQDTDFTLRSLPVNHNPESIAYRITGSGGRCVVYSGDTDFSTDLIRLARGADLLICEAALPDEMKVAGHLTPTEAGEIAARARVGQLVLTHFYPQCDQVDVQSQCRKTWAGPLLLAQDLMQIRL